MKKKIILLCLFIYFCCISELIGQVLITVDTQSIITPIADTLGYKHGASKKISYSTPQNYTLDSIYLNKQYNSSYTRDSINGFSFTNIVQKNYLRVVYSFTNYTINASANVGGTISPIGTTIVGLGDSLRFTITANAGYYIDSLLVNNIKIDTTSNYTFKNIIENKTIRVIFKLKTYAIVTTAGLGGSISPLGIISIVNYGTRPIFTFTPNTGYAIDSVIINGRKIETVNSYQFDSVKSNQTIRVTFKQLCSETRPTPNIVRVGLNLQSNITTFSKYKWYFDGLIKDSSSVNSYSPTTVGVYTLLGVDSNGCASNISNKYYYSPTCITPTGRLGNGASIQANIVDNSNQIIIKWCPDILKNILTIQVVDFNGNMLLEQKVFAKIGGYILDKNTIKANQYFIKVLDENNEVVQLSDLVIEK